jgi:23S rRNA (uracil1939-C5)-methyltransferase
MNGRFSRSRIPRRKAAAASETPTETATGEEVRVEITGLAPGGDAVGRQVGGSADGRVTFVPFAAPGEVVRAALVRQRARVAWADLLAVERSSPARVGPHCPLFGTCGGCQWQHVDDRIQRSSKGDIVARALGITLTEATAVGPSYGYRERVRLAVDRPASPPTHDVPGTAVSETIDAGPPAAANVVGFRARRSHEVIDVPACPLLAPALDRALPLARERAAGLLPGRELSLLLGRGDLVVGEVEGSGFQVVESAGAGGDAAALRPALAPVDLRDASCWPDVAEPGSRPLHVPPRGFAQVSRAANAALVAAVGDALSDRPGRVLELFAGSGNFTRQLVAVASSVVASDGDAEAVARGRLNVPEADWRPAASLGTSVLPVDTVLVDPPREGLDERSLALCAAGRRLVYVSCDPQTLCRDMGHLLRRGMRFEGAVAFDVMPQTDHIEVVALFTHR